MMIADIPPPWIGGVTREVVGAVWRSHEVPLKWLLLVELLGAPKEVLDCGCGSGDLAAYLSKSGFRVTGVDIASSRVAEARAKGVTVIEGDLESEETWSRLPQGWPAILFSDSLEHTRDPEGVLLMARRSLAPGGVVVIGTPNVAFWRIRTALLRGRWVYESEGICDRTHLRFFTMRSVRELVEASGFTVDRLLPLPGWSPGLPRWRALLHATTAIARPELFGTGFLIRAR